jgi:hypothetical protein
VSLLKRYDQAAQQGYNSNFQFPGGPVQPKVSVSELNREIILSWDNAAESYDEQFLLIPEKDELGNPLQRDYRFQGYIVYQYPDADFEEGEVIATYDISGDDIMSVWNYSMDSEDGIQMTDIVYGTDSGIERYIRITEDKLTKLDSKRIINGRTYYFGVQAYAYTPDGPDDEKVIFSPIAQITAQPRGPAIGTRYSTQFNDTLEVTKNGVSDGSVIVTVVDPLKVTGLNYTVTFEEDTTAGDGSYMWDLVRSDGVTVLNDMDYQGASETDDQFSVVDGLLVKVLGPTSGISHVYEVAYDGTALAALDNVWHNLNSNSTYYMSAGGGSGDYDRLNRYGAFSSPRDFELRWTDGTNYGVSAFSTDNIMSVPFELWDIGIATPDDASDDVRMIPFIYENVERNTFGYDGDVDPYFGYPASDWIYWMDPEGTDGYANFAAACEGAGGPGNTYPYDTDGSSYGYWADMSAEFVYPIGRLIVCDYDLDLSDNIIPSGTIVRLITLKSNSDLVTFSFTSPEPYSTVKTNPKSDINLINVYPNPYYGGHPGEDGSNNHWVRFTHLPPTCTIRIFTVSGGLVRKIERKNNDDPQETWDLRNSSNYPVCSGVYIYLIKIPNVGEKVGKIAVIQSHYYFEYY